MDRLGAQVDEANTIALRRMLDADPILVDVIPAKDAIPTLNDRVILHAGPPVSWQQMCGPMRGAVAGIAVFEGWASSLDNAAQMAKAGEFSLQPNHHFAAVGPMTGMTTQSQWVMVVENRTYGNRSFCTVNEGIGKVLRFGGNDESVQRRLCWLRDEFAPALSKALRITGGVPLKELVARGLTMGDEMHQRNAACSGLLLRALAPALARTCTSQEQLATNLEFVAGNDQFFLNVAMAMGKAIMDPVRDIRNSSVVTAMARNGYEFGIRVSGLGDEWFIAPVEMPQGLYFPGYSSDDANPDMGDSTIVETVGLGGFAMAASPAVAGFVGAGTAAEAARFTEEMAEITIGQNPEWTIPSLDYQGVPTGIDVRLVADSSVAPTINTGIAHKLPGVGQVGAGVVKAPLQCFTRAARKLREMVHKS